MESTCSFSAEKIANLREGRCGNEKNKNFNQRNAFFPTCHCESARAD